MSDRSISSNSQPALPMALPLDSGPISPARAKDRERCRLCRRVGDTDIHDLCAECADSAEYD